MSNEFEPSNGNVRNLLTCMPDGRSSYSEGQRKSSATAAPGDDLLVVVGESREKEWKRKEMETLGHRWIQRP